MSIFIFVLSFNITFKLPTRYYKIAISRKTSKTSLYFVLENKHNYNVFNLSTGLLQSIYYFIVLYFFIISLATFCRSFKFFCPIDSLKISVVWRRRSSLRRTRAAVQTHSLHILWFIFFTWIQVTIDACRLTRQTFRSIYTRPVVFPAEENETKLCRFNLIDAIVFQKMLIMD